MIPAGSYLMSLIGDDLRWNSTTGMHAALLLTSGGSCSSGGTRGGHQTSAEHSATIVTQPGSLRPFVPQRRRHAHVRGQRRVKRTHACSPVSPANAPRFVSGDGTRATADAAYYILRGTVWARASDKRRATTAVGGQPQSALPRQLGSANIYVPETAAVARQMTAPQRKGGSGSLRRPIHSRCPPTSQSERHCMA